VKTTLITLLLLTLTGCGLVQQSKIEVPIPGDGVQTFTGKVADEYMAMKVANEKTATGRVNDAIGSLTKLLPFLFATLLIGGVFAFWTRSKYAALIPITAAIGMGLIFFLASWISYIKWAMLGVTVAIVIWRAAIYQRERNEAEGKS